MILTFVNCKKCDLNLEGDQDQALIQLGVLRQSQSSGGTMSGSRRRQSQAGTSFSTPQPCQGSKEGPGQGPDLAEKLRHLVHKYADQVG